MQENAAPTLKLLCDKTVNKQSIIILLILYKFAIQMNYELK